MKKYLVLIMMAFLLLFEGASAEIVDEATQDKMTNFNYWLDQISPMPEAIDGDICRKDWDAYKKDMNQLAVYIVNANEAIKDVQLHFPIDLWYIYNTISAQPICGIVKFAGDAFSVAKTSAVSNEEKMGILKNDDICMCWNLATGRDEPTGFYKDGACRCTYGTKAYSPNIGLNVEWFTDTTSDKK